MRPACARRMPPLKHLLRGGGGAPGCAMNPDKLGEQLHVVTSPASRLTCCPIGGLFQLAPPARHTASAHRVLITRYARASPQLIAHPRGPSVSRTSPTPKICSGSRVVGATRRESGRREGLVRGVGRVVVWIRRQAAERREDRGVGTFAAADLFPELKESWRGYFPLL